jgi:hypothetical protein
LIHIDGSFNTKYQAAISNNFMDVDVWKSFSFNHCVCGDIDLHRSRTFQERLQIAVSDTKWKTKKHTVDFLMNRVFVKNKKYTIIYICIYIYSYLIYSIPYV